LEQALDLAGSQVRAAQVRLPLSSPNRRSESATFFTAFSYAVLSCPGARDFDRGKPGGQCSG